MVAAMDVKADFEYKKKNKTNYKLRVVFSLISHT